MKITIIKFRVILFVLITIKSVISSSNHTFLSSYSIGDETDMITGKNTVNNLLRIFSPAITDTGFYNSTSISHSSNNNLYGLYLCRGDINRELCRECVKDALKYIYEGCHYGQEAGVWFDHCMLRYSNKPFFGKLDLVNVSYTWTNSSVTGNTTRFTQILSNTMNYLAIQAANGRKGKKFATKVVKFTEDETLYVLVQCTPDLTTSDCRKCLVNSIGVIRGHMGASNSGTVQHLSCTIRFEMFPFFYSDKIKQNEIRLTALDSGATSE